MVRKGDWYQSISADREISEFQKTLERQTKVPPNKDWYVASCAEAMLADWDLLEPPIRGGFDFRRNYVGSPINPHIYPNLVQRAIFKQARRLDKDHWPTYFEGDQEMPAYLKPEAYRKLFRLFLPVETEGTAVQSSEFEDDISHRANMANSAERAKTLILILISFADRIGPMPRIGDFGCSANHWLNAIGCNYPLSPVTVMEQVRSGRLRQNKAATSAVNAALNKHVPIGSSVGFDAWDWERDEDIREWVRDCTLTPAELAASIRMDRISKHAGTLAGGTVLSPLSQYSYLDDHKPPMVDFCQMDITDEYDIRTFLESYGHQVKEFDLVNAGTALQQQSVPRRRTFLANMDRFKSPPKKRKLKLITDFARPDPDNPAELLFEDDIYSDRWLYRTMILDPLNPEGWQEILIWETGRCARVKLGLGKVSVGDELRTIAQQLGVE